MKILITMLESILCIMIAWFVLPKLVFRTEFSHILPGVQLASTLSLKHLTHLGCLIFIYAIFIILNGPGYIGAFFIKRSAPLKALVIFTLVFSVYLHASPTHSGDNIPSKLIPISLVEEGNLDLNEFRYAIYRGHHYSLLKQGEKYYSTYPVFSGIVVSPLYATVKWLAPDVFALWKQEYSVRNGDLNDGFVQTMHRFSAAFISSLAVLVFWLIANHLGVPTIISLPTTLTFAFGTPMMSTTAGALWSHGPAILFLLLAVFFSASHQQKKPTNLGFILAGIFAAAAIACRPTSLIAASLLGVYLAWKYRQNALYYILPGVVFCVGASLINLGMYGKLLGGYQGQTALFTLPTVQRLYQLLCSPSRGLLTFTPGLLLLLFAIPQLYKPRINLLTLAMTAAGCELILYTCWTVWWGGNCFGPRLLTDCLMWCLLGILAANVHFKAKTKTTKAVWLGGIVLSIYSVCLHLTGGIYGDGNWDRDYFRQEPGVLMHWKNSQITWTLTDIRNAPENNWQP